MVANTKPRPMTEGGEGALDEDDLITEIDQRRKDARSAAREDWFEEARTCYGFVAGAGQQWEDADKKILADQKRPIIEFNQCGGVIDVVSGLEVSNRQEVQYLPREVDDSGLGELWSGAAKWVRDECNAEDEESEAFADAAICGEGWIETRLDYEYDPDGAIVMQRTDPLGMLPDPNSRRKNYTDAEYLIYEAPGGVSIDWAMQTWPDKADELEAQAEADADDTDALGRSTRVAGDQYQSPFKSNAGTNYGKKRVTLTEYQVKRREPYYRVQDPQSGQIVELPVPEFEQASANAKMLGVRLQAVKQFRCVHYRAFKIGSVLLEYAKCPDPNSFTYRAITAKRDRNKKCWYGVIRGTLDPQRWSNKWISQWLHIVNSNAKGGVIAESDAFDRKEDFERTYADPRAVTIVKPGAIGQQKLMPKPQPTYPAGFAELVTLGMQALRTASGINVELLGMTDREQSGVLEYQRKQAGITILASLFDALRRYRKEQGKNLLYLIKTYISDGRLIRISGKKGAKYIPLTKQEGAEKYDIVVDEAPSSPNMKDRTWQVIQTLLPILLQAGIPVPPEVMEYLPLPQSLLDSFKPDPGKEQEQQQMKQLQLRGQVAAVTKTESEAQRNIAAAQKDMAQAQEAAQGEQMSPAEIAKAHAVAQRSQVDTQIAAQKAQNEAAKTQNDMALDNARFANERSRSNADRALQLLKTIEGIKTDRMKVRHQQSAH